MEGDDPSIFWTFKGRDGYGPNCGKTAGPYAVDVDAAEPIRKDHSAVLFDDRVTPHDFLRGNRNCSYFAISSVEVAPCVHACICTCSVVAVVAF